MRSIFVTFLLALSALVSTAAIAAEPEDTDPDPAARND